MTAFDRRDETDGLPLPRRRTAYIALALATSMAVIDGSIANTALPTIARDLQASPAASIWIVNGFQLAVAISLFSLASLGQLRGASRTYGAGVALFVVGSLGCALSRSLLWLVLCRVLQGLGAAGIMAIAPALLRSIFPRRELGRALGLNAVVIATSAAAGPTLGGILLAVAPWPWLFAINVPLGIANLALNRTLPQDAPRPGRFDVPSAVASALGFALVVWGLDGFARGESGASIAARTLTGTIAIGWFARRQFRLERPMIDLDLFAYAPFSFAAATSFAAFVAQGLAFVALPFYFQETLHHTPFDSGLLLTSWPLTIACVAPLAGRLSDRYPAGLLATAGLALLTLALAAYGFAGNTPSTTAIVLHGAACGIGFGFFQAPNNRELIGSAPRAKTLSAAAVLAAVRIGGQTTGASIVAILFGVLGAAAVHGRGADAGAMALAAPLALRIAAAFAGVATIASGSRLWWVRSDSVMPSERAVS